MAQCTRRSILRGGLSLAATAAAGRFVFPALATPNATGAPVAIPFDMPGYVEPVFADRTFVITDHGARSGGEVLNTVAIAEAIAACTAAGGGRVLVPAGVWLTGPIHLKDNVNLHLAEGAELRFSDRFEHYLPVVYMQRGGTRC
ncbi:MAG: glycoside hydrolase family 28 protein, partial [Patescibacteria group bacterium]|nr:glycoside hydrolase family 28 protein [Patescibacteria group bacterium]